MSNPLTDYGVSDDVWNGWSADERKAATDSAMKFLNSPDTKINWGFGVGLPVGTWTANGQTFNAKGELKSGATQVKEAAQDATTGWVGPLMARLSFGFNVTGAFVLGILLVIVGVVILIRKPLGVVASPGGKLKAVSAVAGALNG